MTRYARGIRAPQPRRRFATAGSGDRTVKVWFTAGLQQEAKLASDPDATSAVAFEPGG